MGGPISIINRMIFKAPPTKVDPPYALVYDLETKEVGIVSIASLNNQNQILKYGTIQIIDHKAVIAEDDFNWTIDGVDYINVPAYESATIPDATPGYFRTDIIVGGAGVYIYVLGTESETEAPRPPVPDGTIFLGEIPIFGDIIGEPVYSDDYVLKTNIPNRTYGTNALGEQITYATADKEDVSNKQNSLVTDPTNQKFPTVTAVNAGDANTLSSANAYTDSKISSVYRYKGNVPNYAALPGSGQVVGDVWNALDTDINWAWTGTVWDNLGGSFDVSGKEDKTNKTNIVIGNEASTTLYLNIVGAVTYFQQKLTDSIFGNFITALTAKTTIVDADTSVVSDSADGGKAKKVTLASIFNYIKSKTDIDYSCACSDETSDLTAGTLITFRMPYGMTLNAIKLSVNVAPTGSKIIVDIRKGGVSILSTLVSIDTGSTTSVGAAVAYVISDNNLVDDSIITIITTLVGSSSAGKGLKVTLIGKRI